MPRHRELLRKVEKLAEKVKEVKPRKDREREARLDLARRIRALQIQPKEGGVVPFEPKYAQKRFIALVVMLLKLDIPIRVIVLKSRQLGFSTLIEAIIFVLTWFFPSINALIIAHRMASAKDIFRMTKLFYNTQSDDYRRELVTKERGPSRDSLEYDAPHNSKIDVLSAGGNQIGRGATKHHNHYSEVAFWPQDEETWAATQANVPKLNEARNNSIFVESTANGVGNKFHTIWEESLKVDRDWCVYVDGKRIKLYRFLKDNPNWGGWIGVFESWKYDKLSRLPIAANETFELDEIEAEYAAANNLDMEQMKWARHVRKNDYQNKWETFHQEYPVSPEVAFLYTGYSYFDTPALDECISNLESNEPVFRGDIAFEELNRPKPKLIPHHSGDLYIWKHPEPARTYVVSMDVAEGIRADYSEIMVLDNERNLCAYWYSNITNPMDAGIKAYLLGCYYYWAVIAVERQGPGQGVIGCLNYGHADFPAMGQYPNLFYETVLDTKTQEKVQRIGFQTNMSSKQTALAELQEVIYKKKMTGLHSYRVLQQLRGFTLDPNKRGRDKYKEKYQDPVSGLYADDAVMTLAIGEHVLRKTLEDRPDAITWANW